MKNFSWSYVRKNPWLFGGIFLVFGLGLFLLLNRGGGGSSASGGGTVVSGGLSEGAQLQAMAINAQAQGQAMAIQAQREQTALSLEAAAMQIEGQQNLAILSSQVALAELEASKAITSEQTAASLAALNAQLANSYAMQELQVSAGVETARLVQDSALQQMAIGAMMQRQMGEQQLEAFRIQTNAGVTQSLISQVSSLKRKDRDTALAAITAANAGYGFSGGKGDDYIQIGGGSGTRLNNIVPSGNPLAFIGN